MQLLLNHAYTHCQPHLEAPGPIRPPSPVDGNIIQVCSLVVPAVQARHDGRRIHRVHDARVDGDFMDSPRCHGCAQREASQVIAISSSSFHTTAARTFNHILHARHHESVFAAPIQQPASIAPLLAPLPPYEH